MKSLEFLPLIEAFDQYAMHNLADPKDKEVTKVDELVKVAEIIEANCTTMLAAYKAASKILYRGIKSNNPVVITNIRPDRRPVEMPKDAHDALHDAFLQLGLTATRKNSIFCTTDYGIASAWGNNVYVVFVKDGWTGTVFTKHTTGYAFNQMQDLATDILWKKGSKPGDLAKLPELINKEGPLTFNNAAGLTHILKTQYEDILITGSSYIAVKYNSPVFPKLRTILGLSW
jgi:hypothetical protein